MKLWLFTAGAGLILFVLSVLALAGALWMIAESELDKETQLAAVFVFGLAFLLTILSGIVAALHALELTSPKSAFGLPAGSVRAIIALVLILIFVMMGVYLVEAVFLKEDGAASPEAQNAATQILAMLGTLVTAVAAFYFGTAAVTAGTTAASAAVASSRVPTKPSASTKGSKAVEGGYELVGFVHPHALETQYFFDYGPDQTYGNKTAPASAGAANADSEVTSAPLPLEKGWHLRLVAFSDAGTSYGADAEVTDDPVSGEVGAPDEPGEDVPEPKPGAEGAAEAGDAEPEADQG